MSALVLIPSLVACACSGEESDEPSQHAETGGVAGAASGGVQQSSGGTGSGSAPTGGTTSSGGTDAGGASSASGGSAGAGVEPPVELESATVWIAGDSTVANGNTPCPVGWGKSFDGLFDERITVVNSAVGGRSVRTWLYDVTDQKDGTGECVRNEDTEGELVLQQRWVDMQNGMKPGDFLLIQFGINDGSSACPRHVGLTAFRESYAMMANAALEHGAQPVFLTPVSAIACNGSQPVGTRGGYVQAVLDEGESLGVPVIDLHARSVALYGELGFCPIPGGDVSATTGGEVGEFFCDDHTHFDMRGALQIADLVAAGLKDANVTLAEYLL